MKRERAGRQKAFLWFETPARVLPFSRMDASTANQSVCDTPILQSVEMFQEATTHGPLTDSKTHHPALTDSRGGRSCLHLPFTAVRQSDNRGPLIQIILCTVLVLEEHLVKTETGLLTRRWGVHVCGLSRM